MKTAVNGIEIGYDEVGDGTWLVLCHALGLDRSLWTDQVQAFSQRHRVLAWDARGHGESSKPAGPYDFDMMADDLAGLLDVVGAKQAAVLGLSMGGDIAMAFASRLPTRVSALVLADTTAWNGPGAARTYVERIDAVRKGGVESLLPAQANRWFTDEFRLAHPERVDLIMGILARADSRGYIAVLQALANLDLRRRLAGIRCPTLVLVGDQDPVSPPAMAEELNRGIPNSTLRVIEKAKHMTPVERPEEFNLAVLEFLEDTSERA